MFFKTRYVDKETGRNFFILEVGFHFPSLFARQKQFLRKKLNDLRNWLIRWKNGTYSGLYVWRNGMLQFASSKVGIFDIWFHKNKQYDDQGERELHNFYVTREEKGELNDVDDQEVWQESLRKYGRGRVDVGCDDRVHRDRRR